MTKRRRKVRASPRRALFKRKSSRRRSKGTGVKPFQIEAIGYGVLRKTMSGLLTPVSNMLPLGAFSDEVSIGLVDYFVAKNTSGMIKNVALAGLTFENVMIGADLANSIPMLSGNSTSNNNLFVGGY